jgi:hypothetical protein
MTKVEIVGIIVIDFKGLMISLMSYYGTTIQTTFPKRGACEKVKIEMVVSNPWFWGIFPWYWKLIF